MKTRAAHEVAAPVGAHRVGVRRRRAAAAGPTVGAATACPSAGAATSARPSAAASPGARAPADAAARPSSAAAGAHSSAATSSVLPGRRQRSARREDQREEPGQPFRDTLKHAPKSTFPARR